MPTNLFADVPKGQNHWQGKKYPSYLEGSSAWMKTKQHVQMVLNCAYNHNYVEEQYINKITELSCRNSGTGNLFSVPSSLFHAEVHPVVIPSVVNTRIFASLRRWQHLPAQHDTSIEFSHGRCFPNDALPGQSALMKIWGLLL